ncbi:hypothetical protein OCAR_6733 [Afipia carboxidovorans OM5]|nr:hypothetical protein OCAR_6733 [Afipia carboxidovorans OM5]
MLGLQAVENSQHFGESLRSRPTRLAARGVLLLNVLPQSACW